MQRLGKVLHASKRGLIARAEQVPKLGAKVHDQKNKLVGRVSDIFGPTSTPYIAIKPVSNIDPHDIAGLVNEEMYIRGDKTHGKKKEE
jgi:RNA-binding protein